LSNLKKIVITGAAGFVGKKLIEELLNHNYLVIALINRKDIEIKGNPNLVTYNLHDALNEGSTILGATHALIHLAAKTHSSINSSKKNYLEFKKVNLDLTTKLINKAIEKNVDKIIFLSSVKAMGEESLSGALTETHTPSPQDNYGKTKLLAEEKIRELCSKNGANHIILRSPLIYGPNSKGNLRLLEKLINYGIPLPIKNIDNGRSFIFIENLVDAIITSIKNKNNISGTYLISDNEVISTPNLIRKIAEIKGRKHRLVNFPLKYLRYFMILLRQKKKFDSISANLIVSNSKYRKDFNWNPPFTSNLGLKKSFTKK